jgi:hypothetical protein
VLFNIFINDIFYFISDSSLHNYADDNTLSYSGYNLDKIINTLERDSLNLIDWFTSNRMKANPDKYQAIAIGKNTQSKNISFNLNGNIIKTENEVKLLGVTIDYELKFNSHITNICRKASRQLNVLKRMGKYLNRLGKLTIYCSFILSNINYWPVICHFCSEANTKKMEKIHESAARALTYIYNENHSTYEELLAKLKLPSLKIRRIRTIAICLYMHILMSDLKAH